MTSAMTLSDLAFIKAIADGIKSGVDSWYGETLRQAEMAKTATKATETQPKVEAK